MGSGYTPPSFFVEGFEFFPDFVEVVTISHHITESFGTFVTPLHPAAGVGYGTFFLDCRSTGNEEGFGFDLLGIHVRTFPEIACFALERG